MDSSIDASTDASEASRDAREVENLADTGAESGDSTAPSSDADIAPTPDAGGIEWDSGQPAFDASLTDGNTNLEDASSVVANDAEAGTETPGDASTADGGSACAADRAPNIGVLGLRAVFASPMLQGLTDAVQAPGSNDWYLVEQRGRVVVLPAGATELLPEPFLDLTSEISLPNARTYDDRGLVSIAFAPDYATSGRVYVSVTPDTGDNANLDLLLEYTRSSDNRWRLDPGSRRVIVEVRGRRLSSNTVTTNIHNGGRVTFGPDGMLYWANGDGGGVNCGDVEPDAAQDISTLFGKILRLDLTRPEPYGAADNPFVNSGDPRVYHYGLRNPFRFSFDKLTGDFYLGDVGQNRYEEIDFAPRNASGLNFGWPAFEGNSRDTCSHRELRTESTHTTPIFVATQGTGATGPFADYNAMIGGVVYRGLALPQLQGVYLFGGYHSRRLGALYQCGTTTSMVTPVLKSCDPNEPNAACLRRLDNGAAFRELRAFVEDHDGEVYVVANGNSLLKIVPNQ